MKTTETLRRFERIAIGDTIITLIRIDRDRAIVGVEAPRHIPVHRLEHHELLEQQRREVAAIGTTR